MKVILIVAQDLFGVIGHENKLPWNLPDDMKYFKDQTVGHAVIMGRKTWESIPERFRPLPNRLNLILSTNKDYNKKVDICETLDVCSNLEEAISFAEKCGNEKIFIIGGSQIYNLAMKKDLVDILLVTEVYTNSLGDTKFPTIDWTQWDEIHRVHHPIDDKHSEAFDFVTYEHGTKE